MTLPEPVAYILHLISTACATIFLLLLPVMLILEYGTRNHAALDVGNEYQSPEEAHGFLSRALLLWINLILLKGCKSILTQADMMPLNQDMMPEFTREKMVEVWPQRCR